MVTREFLGWERPFLWEAAAWLLERRDELPSWLVVVPTAQSGRRLREALADRAGALLAPRMVTPGWFLRPPVAGVAADWMERLAWLESLENIRDWSRFEDLFPKPPVTEGDWAGGLAKELLRLRQRLQENGHTLKSAAKALAGSIEQGRWEALARLEFLMERQLDGWGLRSRSQMLADGLDVPPGVRGVVLAGITEMPPLLERCLPDWPVTVSALIAAPPSEAEHFSAAGRPLRSWSERRLPWPEGDTGSVRLTADSRQQAVEAFQAVCEAGFPSDQVALGSADPDTSATLVRVFRRGGWPAFDPAAAEVKSAWFRWLRHWAAWLEDSKLSVAADLLTQPCTDALVPVDRQRLAAALARIRDRTMAVRFANLESRVLPSSGHSGETPTDEEALQTFLKRLEDLKHSFLTNDFNDSINRLLQNFPVEDSDGSWMREWLDEAGLVMERVERSPGFWLGWMLEEAPEQVAQPPEGRVIDVQGWLELLFEPGAHLVVCGMNEGRVPAAGGGDPWLGESGAARLGLVTQEDRAARDAFLFQAMVAARRAGGRVDVLVAKVGPAGEAWLPSRLLLAAEGEELAARVRHLFREVEPPEAGLRWHADWRWEPARVEVSRRLGVTSLRAWLACPFRFYLQHGLGMQRPEPERVEWNARDFGNVAHEILERWGRDAEARDFTKGETLAAWFSAQLDRVVAAWFGRRVPLAIRVQAESLRQRLTWLAREQAVLRAEGWETIEVEHKFELRVDDWVVVAKIDRIDRHRDDGRLRVIDYKTGRVDDVEREHRRRIVAATKLPDHVPADSPVVHDGVVKGKPTAFRWTNLQLPLYALAIRNRDAALPEPCYFRLGETEAKVGLAPWTGFSNVDLESAEACMRWVVGRIAAGVFWPPAEGVDYDDFEVLAAGRSLREMLATTTGGAENAG